MSPRRRRVQASCPRSFRVREKLRQPFLQRRRLDQAECLEHLIRKLPPQDGAELGDFLSGVELIQAGHERILQGGGDGHGGQRSSQGIVACRVAAVR
jgi:hypothetical protein